MRALSSISSVVVLVTLFPRTAFADCTKDVECKGDRICVESACVDPPTRAAELPPSTAPQATAVKESPAPPAADAASLRSPRMVRRSDPLFIGGIVAMALSPVGFVTAVAFQLQKDNCAMGEQPVTITNGPGPRMITSDCTRFDPFIIASMATGFALGGAGLAMFLVGGEKVPAAKETAKIRPWFSPATAGLSVQTTF